MRMSIWRANVDTEIAECRAKYARLRLTEHQPFAALRLDVFKHFKHMLPAVRLHLVDDTHMLLSTFAIQFHERRLQPIEPFFEWLVAHGRHVEDLERNVLPARRVECLHDGDCALKLASATKKLSRVAGCSALHFI